ncbi:3'-5' exonuclease [Variovorax sp. ZS18.2.2]|uniref:exonuclease domain-containing protein n=1 Tax=Variovorax sp. ZS18.2.2 TaxID=2971255 RepID=UPI002150C5E5|nr:3'-5' exonuclease [Variovorax sp. ZS18.2.2]MCR6476873.1 3'-5' exonuclease [Variovorax sp. ZS18.2.2]
MINLNHKNLVAIDVETSGANPFKHDVLAIGIFPINRSIPPKNIYIRHEAIEWSSYAHEIFQAYATEWREKAVSPTLAYIEIEKYISENFQDQTITPVGHNIGFDLVFLKKLAFQSGNDQISGISHRAVDTHSLLYVLALENKIPSSAVTSDGAFSYFEIEIKEKDRHTAIGDAEATSDLLRKILNKFGEIT